jgi:hypothetical protein
MKSLTVQLPDDVYSRAEHRAAQRGATLPAEVVEWVKRYSEADNLAVATEDMSANGASSSADVTRLFAALDRGRNSTSIGPLKRDELHDRRVLH